MHRGQNNAHPDQMRQLHEINRGLQDMGLHPERRRLLEHPRERTLHPQLSAPGSTADVTRLARSNPKHEADQYFRDFCHSNHQPDTARSLALCYTTSREDNGLSKPASIELLKQLGSLIKRESSNTMWTHVLRVYCEDASNKTNDKLFKNCILDALASDTRALLRLDRCDEFRRLKTDLFCAPHLISLLLEAVYEVDRRK
ncbi:MAG: hypothetical protein L6R38_002969 [Xanthoria sp. 2 TBL-2021]|nr:MAG: hypothetical protein L6R38_002969 [Xanthoria sp. 2 TBL-2021]